MVASSISAAFAVHSMASMAITSSFIPSSAALADVPTSSCPISMSVGDLQDCTSGAIAFFNSVRVPSSLVAGSALGALFSLVQETKTGKNKTRLELFVIQLYHACALFSFVLSISTILTTTTANTALLLGKHDAMARDVYHFMKREVNFEFVLTR